MSHAVEYSFFFILLGLAGYMVWLIFQPFISALALSAIIVTICYPFYNQVRKVLPKKSKNLAALLTTLTVLVLIVIPLVFLSSLVVREAVSFYQSLSSGQELSFDQALNSLEATISGYLPGFTLDLTGQIKQITEWLIGNLGAIFAGTLSTLFIFMISLIGSFYFFRDGKQFLQLLIKASPLPDKEDEIIFKRMAQAVRTVAMGTLLVSVIQGALVSVGLAMVGIDRFVLLGSVAALLAIIPGVGTSAITLPTALYLIATGNVVHGVGLLIWAIFVVGMVDNLLGPHLMSRGNNLHPFIILISVLGGLSLFGPIGFIVGPVVVTLFIVLLEIYNQYIIKERSLTTL